MAISVVSFSFCWCSNGGPGAQLSAECWLSLPHLVTNGSPKLLVVPRTPSAGSGFSYHILSPTSLIPNSSGAPRAPSAGLSLPHLISNSSGPQLIKGLKGPFGLVWLSLPHLVSNSVRSLAVWHLVLTELYNSSTSTQSPTQSLEWRVWLSSSENNCHAVQRSLSSGASVYECIMAFTLSHFISQIRPRDLFRLLAIGMYHFLPVHHFGMACLPGPKVNI